MIGIPDRLGDTWGQPGIGALTGSVSALIATKRSDGERSTRLKILRSGMGANRTPELASTHENPSLALVECEFWGQSGRSGARLAQLALLRSA